MHFQLQVVQDKDTEDHVEPVDVVKVQGILVVIQCMPFVWERAANQMKDIFDSFLSKWSLIIRDRIVCKNKHKFGFQNESNSLPYS